MRTKANMQRLTCNGPAHVSGSVSEHSRILGDPCVGALRFRASAQRFSLPGWLSAEGRINKEIADFLHLRVKTVEGHKDNIKKKLNIRDTAGMVKYAIKEKIIRLA